MKKKLCHVNDFGRKIDGMTYSNDTKKILEEIIKNYNLDKKKKKYETYKDFYYVTVTAYIPILNDVRGKIVILYRQSDCIYNDVKSISCRNYQIWEVVALNIIKVFGFIKIIIEIYFPDNNRLLFK